MVRQLSDEVCDALRERIRRFLASRPDLGMLDLTHHTTLSDSAGKNFLNGFVPGGREIVAEFTRVIALAEAGDILAPGRGHGILLTEVHPERVRHVAKQRNFYQTETVRKVAEALDFCAENCTIGVITADYGVGKTESIKDWRRRSKVESLVFEFDEFSSANKVDFVHQLAAMLGLTTAPGTQAAGSVFRALCDALRERPCLLIFDQCETVRARVMQVVRQIWDHTHDSGVGVALLAAPILMTRMTLSRIADLGALTSRVGVWATLQGLSRAEMAAIVKQEDLGDIDETAFDLWWHSTGGSMRRLMRAVDLLKAKHAGKRITEKTIVTMASYLWGMQVRPEAV
jgi:DNA transposition AAA+ family ATPase